MSEGSVAAVSPHRRRVYGSGRKRVVLVDCGANPSLVHELTARRATVIRVPWDHDFLREDFHAVVVSNGPGEPRVNVPLIRNLERAMRTGRPLMGICLGHQLLALAAGARTYKLRHGHLRHRQPCIETGSGRCYMTVQNHGYAVDPASLPAGWEAWFTNADDGSNEGIRHRSKPFLGVQFQPGSACGAVDARHLLDDFLDMVS